MQLTLETNIAIANHHVCVAVVAIRRPSSSVKGANRMHQRAADLNLHGTRFHGAVKQAVKIVFTRSKQFSLGSHSWRKVRPTMIGKENGARQVSN